MLIEGTPIIVQNYSFELNIAELYSLKRCKNILILYLYARMINRLLYQHKVKKTTTNSGQLSTS